jgi:hypothetical protein
MLFRIRTIVPIVLAIWILQDTPAGAANAIVRQFGSGDGLDAVGIVDASADTDIDGPQAIYVGDNGEVYLLDQVNGRVLQFDPKRNTTETRAYELPSGLQPTDLVVSHGHIMVWDGDAHALQPTGPENAPVRGLDEVSTRDLDDEFTLSAFAQMGSQKPLASSELLEDANTRSVRSSKGPARLRQAIATRGEGPVLVDVASGDHPTFATLDVRRKQDGKLLAKLRIAVRDRLGTVEFLEIDKQGRMFVLAENIPSSDKKLAAAFVAQFSLGGRLERIYDIPLYESMGLSRRFIAVSPDGDVYFLRTRKTGVDVIGVGSRIVRNEAVIDTIGPAPAAQGASFKEFVAAVRPLNRQQVIQTAFAFEGVQWKLTASAYGRDPDTACSGFHRIRRPAYLIGKLGQEVRGVPYCWGCHGSLVQIGAKLAHGVLAGNVCTHNEPRTDVTGVDCSAFVSAAWGLSQHFTTSAIPSITNRIENAWDLRPGDALDKPGSHVVLFLGFTNDRKAEVMEAAPGACNGRVCRNVYPLASLLARGFIPVRFRALANEPAPQLAESKPDGKEGRAKRKQRSHSRERDDHAQKPL